MLTLTVNHTSHKLDVDPQTPLLWVLREHLGLTGTKYSCGTARCGACTVHVDGEAHLSCVTALEDVKNKAITTIEGVFESAVGEALRQAWIAEDVPQCGFCQPGQIMTAASLLVQTPNFTEDDLNAVMSSVLCRCGTYLSIRRAILRASKELAQ